MKKIFLLIIFSTFLHQCTPFQMGNTGNSTGIKPEKNDNDEWELLVMDAQYESFLAGEARPKSMYTEEYLKSKNTFLVQEWNSLYYNKAFPAVIESTIQYDPMEKYGFQFEYRLYQVFAMVNSRYGVSFSHLGQMDKKR